MGKFAGLSKITCGNTAALRSRVHIARILPYGEMELEKAANHKFGVDERSGESDKRRIKYLLLILYKFVYFRTVFGLFCLYLLHRISMIHHANQAFE